MATASPFPICCTCSPFSSCSLSNRQNIAIYLSFPSSSPSSSSFTNFFSRRESKNRAQLLISKLSEGVPSELAEDPKFVPLNPDDPVYGPPIQEFLKELDGEFLKVIHCTEDMVTQSIWDAMHTEQPNLAAVKIAKSLPRICFLSGLSGEEMMMVIDAFPETGLKPAVFAALVPNSANKLLIDVAEEIMGDHEMMSQSGNQDS